jgi:diacylglycerol diphosphate phosphatase/phosphatidate phosphatase
MDETYMILQRTWGRISENYQTYNNDDGYLDTKPLRQAEDSEQTGFESTRTGLTGPTPTSGNVFRDEIHSSQRQRKDPGPRGAPSSVYSAEPTGTDTPPPIPRIPVGGYQAQVPGSNPFARTGSRRQLQRDDWDESDEENSEDLELQPSYTLSRPSGVGHYDGTQNPFEGQETSYKAPATGRPSGAPIEHVDGDIGGSVPPPPPPHMDHPQPERATRGVQLFDGPAR